ncbi:hypothetical protein ENBRE01_2820 [Enteropsectra breve]|nr:hypothetical protein ENBRE01_2820 [Enteropsectra breve]
MQLELLDRTEEISRLIAITPDNFSSWEENKESIVRILSSCSYMSFFELSEHVRQFLILACRNELNVFTDVYCSCYNFVKTKWCNHVEAHLRAVNRLDLIIITMLSCKSSRGRPKKSKKMHL